MRALNLLAAIASLQGLDDSGHQVVKIGDFVPKVSIEKGGKTFFKLTLDPQKIPDDEDLVIKVIPLDYVSDPDVYISQTEAFPNSTENSDWQCRAYGKDTCTVNNRNLTANATFYIGVTCENQDCEFQMKVLLTSEFELEDGVEFQTYLYQEDTRLFHFTIPSTIDDSASVVIKASAYRGTVHDFTLSLSSKEKDTASTSLGTRKGVPAWKKGQVIRINKSNYDGWCKGCEVKVLLDVKDEGYYHIMVQSTEATPQLQNNIQIDDIISYGDIQCYKYFVGSADTDMQVTMVTYSGRVGIKANPSVVPDEWDDFKISGDSNETELILDIRPWVRAHQAEQPTGLYFVCARGELTSSYSLKVREFMQNTSAPAELQDGFAEYFFTRNQSMQLFTYTVPRLEYTDEDITIDLGLTQVRGNADLILAAALCEQNDSSSCTDGLTMDRVTQKNSRYQKARSSAGGSLHMSIDHDETKCQALEGPCVYVIAVINPSTEQRAMYKLVAAHSQRNHLMVQECTPHIDSVNIRTYKYFKFTLLEDNENIDNVTIEVAPLHGDSDLFVSRNDSEPFPSKDVYDRRSQRLGSLVDRVVLARGTPEDTSLASNSIATSGSVISAPPTLVLDQVNGSYYIGVYGYTFTTFSILVTVHRTQGHRTSEEQLSAAFTTLLEGFPLTKSLHNELDFFIGRFQVDMADSDDLAIIIDIHNMEGKTKVYIKQGSVPSIFDYDLVLYGETSITIRPGDRVFNRTGIYYITVFSDFLFWDLFRDNYYTFSILWRLENSVPHLNSQVLQSVATSAGGYSMLRHYVQEDTTAGGGDIRLSLLASAGRQDLYVTLGAFDANGLPRRPTNTTYDFTTMFMQGANYMNGKALLLPITLLQNSNAACGDLGYAEEDACVLYIAVYCHDTVDCQGQVELDYESHTPRRIYPGQTKHAIMYSDSINYYYTTITPTSVADVFAVLTPLTGDADLFVSVQPLDKSQSSPPPAGYASNWGLPSASNYSYASSTKLNSAEMIKMPSDDLRSKCGFTANASDECLLIFAIIPSNSSSDNTTEDILYNFVVYRNFLQLVPFTPAYGFVKEGDFSYFLYREPCSNCTVLFSSVGSQSGALELYLNKGIAKGLPSQANFDVKLSTAQSDVLIIDHQADLSEDQHYLIGVYGRKNATFQISAGSAAQPIATITEGVPMANTQGANQQTFYQFYHFIKGEDVQITLDVSSGAADILVTTYNSTEDSLVDRLPRTQAEATWSALDVNSQNHATADKGVLVLLNDRSYCVDCYYMIAVATHQSPAQYRLTVRTIEAAAIANQTHLMQLSVTQMAQLSATTGVQRYQFMLDSKEVAAVLPTVLSGRVKMSVSFGSPAEAFAVQEGDKPGPIQISGKRLQTEKNYYVYLEPLTDKAEVSITVLQPHSILTLHDGVPQLLSYEDSQDVSKYMIFNMPEGPGNTTVVFYVRSKTADFFPHLYISLQYAQSLAFPPNPLVPAALRSDWDQDLYALKASLDFHDLQPGTVLALNLVYNRLKRSQPALPHNNTTEPKKNESAQAMITVSHTKVTVLAAGEDYHGSLPAGAFYRFNLFRLSNPERPLVRIQFAECVGSSSFAVVKDPGNLEDRVPLNIEEEAGMKVATLRDLKGEYFILVEAFTTEVEEEHDYMLRVDFLEKEGPQNLYIPMDDGRIDFQYVRRGDVQLKWGAVSSMDQLQGTQQPVSGVRYKLVFSENPEAVMNSVCAIKMDSQVFTVFESAEGALEYSVALPRGKEVQFNVVAVVEATQTAIPYRPVTLRAPDVRASGGRRLFALVGALLVLCAGLACFFFRRSRKLQARLNAEVRELANDNRPYRHVTDEK